MGWSPSSDRRRKWVAALGFICPRAVRFMFALSEERWIIQLLRELIWACWAPIDSTLGLIALWLLMIMIKWFIIAGL